MNDYKYQWHTITKRTTTPCKQCGIQLTKQNKKGYCSKECQTQGETK